MPAQHMLQHKHMCAVCTIQLQSRHMCTIGLGCLRRHPSTRTDDFLADVSIAVLALSTVPTTYIMTLQPGPKS